MSHLSRVSSLRVIATTGAVFGGWLWLGSDKRSTALNGILLENWSGTHTCSPNVVYKPNSLRDVENIVREMHTQKMKIRCMGSGISPNGIGFSNDNIITLENMNRVLNVDVKKKQITVECGATVGEVLDELKEFDLTLENLASINLQQIGGFTQVGAHGTGASIPPVEEQIVSMEIVSPGLGTIELSRDSHPEWFAIVKCGLGCFGVVTKVTLQCVDAHRLIEDTVVLSREEIKKGHAERLAKNRHVRYMWLPYTNYAVVVTSNVTEWAETSGFVSSNKHAKAPLLDLLQKVSKEKDNKASGLGFAELRDILLKAGRGPLCAEHVKAVNKAELEFWKRSQQKGVVDDSFNVLAFDCGGQQLVLETVLPCGTQQHPNGKDLEFVEAILERIEAMSFPAPAPIEQRWSCGSEALMSPVYDESGKPKDRLFSWVGIIMYLPTKDIDERKAIEEKFKTYSKLVMDINQSKNFGLQTHWAKIEVSISDRKQLKQDVNLFNKVRKQFDPNNCFSNNITSELFDSS